MLIHKMWIKTVFFFKPLLTHLPPVLQLYLHQLATIILTNLIGSVPLGLTVYLRWLSNSVVIKKVSLEFNHGMRQCKINTKKLCHHVEKNLVPHLQPATPLTLVSKCPWVQLLSSHAWQKVVRTYSICIIQGFLGKNHFLG